MIFDKRWSREASDQVALEQRPEPKEVGTGVHLGCSRNWQRSHEAGVKWRVEGEGRESLGTPSWRRARGEPGDGWEAAGHIQAGVAAVRGEVGGRPLKSEYNLKILRPSLWPVDLR